MKMILYQDRVFTQPRPIADMPIRELLVHIADNHSLPARPAVNIDHLEHGCSLPTAIRCCDSSFIMPEIIEEPLGLCLPGRALQRFGHLFKDSPQLHQVVSRDVDMLLTVGVESISMDAVMPLLD